MPNLVDIDPFWKTQKVGVFYPFWKPDFLGKIKFGSSKWSFFKNFHLKSGQKMCVNF